MSPAEAPSQPVRQLLYNYIGAERDKFCCESCKLSIVEFRTSHIKLNVFPLDIA